MKKATSNWGLSLGGRDTAAQWVDVSWPAVAGIEAYVLYRKNLGTDTVEELTRQPGTSYRDSAVAFGDAFAYSLATVLGTTVSLPGATASVTLTPLLPLGNYLCECELRSAPGECEHGGSADLQPTPGDSRRQSAPSTQAITLAFAGCVPQ